MQVSPGLALYNAKKVRDMQMGVRALTQGDFRAGWNYYKSRNQIQWFDRRFKMPVWEGQDIKGKRLLLMYEQGMGEQIYFSSIVPELVDKGVEVILEVDERLVTLMRRSFPQVTVIPYQFPPDEACYTADFQCFLGTAFGYLRPDFESYPVHRGYLKPDYTRFPGIKSGWIGLSWFSNAQHFAKTKNIPFEYWSNLVNNDKYPVMSVQYGSYREPITRMINDITYNIEDCAALLSKCSKVVTVSNTVAHLAGAMGLETYVLVPNGIGRHFYWYPERDFVPNYPTAGAYMQMPAKDWKPCVDYITKIVLDK